MLRVDVLVANFLFFFPLSFDLVEFSQEICGLIFFVRGVVV